MGEKQYVIFTCFERLTYFINNNDDNNNKKGLNMSFYDKKKRSCLIIWCEIKEKLIFLYNEEEEK
jgi:hypothetical protein